MPVAKDTGIIVHTIRYSETSLIVTWFTQNHGIIKTLAKGALRPRQQMAGKIDLFHECHFAFKKSSSTSLHSLIELEVANPHPHVRASYRKLICMTYFFELSAAFSESDTPLHVFYDIFYKALVYLSDHEVSPELVERFERRLIREHGLDDGVTPVPRLMAQLGMRQPKSHGLLHKELQK